MNPERGKSWLFYLFAVATVLATSPAFAGWVVEEVSGPKESQEVTVLYVQDNRIKIVESDTVIFDLNKNRFVILLPERKIYTTGTPEDLAKQMGMASEQMEQMRKMQEEYMQQLPPDQREMIRKQMESMTPRGTSRDKEMALKIEETSEKADIAGYSARKYRVMVDGEPAEDLWISDQINISDEIDLDKMYNMTDSMKGPMAEQSYESTPEYRALQRKGLRLKSIDYSSGYGGAPGEVTIVRKVEKKSIPDSEFQIPAGYREVPFREFINAQAGAEGDYDSETEFEDDEAERE